jgi:hypothetical protein
MVKHDHSYPDDPDLAAIHVVEAFAEEQTGAYSHQANQLEAEAEVAHARAKAAALDVQESAATMFHLQAELAASVVMATTRADLVVYAISFGARMVRADCASCGSCCCWSTGVRRDVRHRRQGHVERSINQVQIWRTVFFLLYVDGVEWRAVATGPRERDEIRTGFALTLASMLFFLLRSIYF